VQTYELGYSAAIGAGPLVIVTLIATSRPAMVLEFGVSLKAVTTGGDLVLGVPASNGSGSAGTALQPLNPSDPAPSAALVSGAFATTQPTAPANPFRHFNWPTAAGGGTEAMWMWEPGELIVPAGGQLVLWEVSGQGTFGGYVKVAEGG
jgi:hypothetical protein